MWYGKTAKESVSQRIYIGDKMKKQPVRGGSYRGAAELQHPLRFIIKKIKKII